ncbi:hypothetical protein AAFF_G00435900 [Aldrovandia affinis]|uniref:PiggyBac transposable element-derived protein domain-containing protein n=1 Tax=Aldrovandia affinis TaxID=143900 RepID=A0AAD7S7V0_9TELE|nr:hypothetical protein AAFF_G00435900 [Aldrovandia affinis]
MFREQCLLIPPTNRQSVDEVTVAYKCTRAGKLWQYIKNKPDKLGFKIFCQGSSSGIIHDIILYQGVTTFCNIQEEEHAHLGLKDLLLGAKIVSILCNTITNKESTVVFYDNFFTSFNLVKRLHTNLGMRSVGTVRVNRSVAAMLKGANKVPAKHKPQIRCPNPEFSTPLKKSLAGHWLTFYTQ